MSDGVTVKELANAFLNHKKALLDAGDISPRTWLNYVETAQLIVEQFGKSRLAADIAQDDFAKLRAVMSKKWGLVRVRNYIQQTRSVFKYGYDSELLATPLRFGPGFAPHKEDTPARAREEGAADVRALPRCGRSSTAQRCRERTSRRSCAPQHP